MFGKMFGTGREQQYSDLEGGDWNSVSGSGRTEAVDPESPVHRRTVPIFVWPLLTAAVSDQLLDEASKVVESYG